MRGIAAATGTHLQGFRHRLTRIPIRNTTLPSSASAVQRPSRSSVMPISLLDVETGCARGTRCRPAPVGCDGLTRSRPRRHRDPEDRERPAGSGPELEIRAGGDAEADAGLQRYRLLPVARAAPHLATAPEDVPDLLHCPVADCDRDLARGKPEVRHGPAG